MQKELGVKFSVTGIPDQAGLRIRSMEPVGLYLSSGDPAAAEWHFETLIVQLVMENKLLEWEPGGGLRLLSELNWPEIIAAGSGEAVVVTATAEEIANVKKVGNLVIMPPVQKLVVDWWEDPSGRSFCIARDKKEIVDKWFLDALEEDLGKAKMH